MEFQEPTAAPSIPWWLWPNVLAFDAPVVGVVWQRFLGSVFNVTIPLSASVVLALVIWAVYLSDRWLDANTHMPQVESDRHRFAGRFRKPLGILCGLVWLAAGACAGFWLPEHYFIAGLWVAIVVAGYFVIVHLARLSRFITGGGKEATVGVLFAAGVSVPLVADAAELRWTWLFAVGAFAAICWLNCEWISLWENETEQPRLQKGWMVAVVGFVFALKSPLPVLATISAAIIALMVIHSVRDRLGSRLARVLADVALLTPLFWFAW
jgi:hypothetical protein